MKCGFQKTIICLNFYLIKVKILLTKLKIKNMNKIICILMFLPILAKAQIDEALVFQNIIRASYFNLDNYKVSDELSAEAQIMADHLAITNEYVYETTDVSLYRTRSEDSFIENYYLDATIFWAVGGEKTLEFQNMSCDTCKEVGYGLSRNNQYVYVVAKYDTY